MITMNKKTNNNDSNAEKDDQHNETNPEDYEVEDEVFERQNYENTAMFEMDIEKAKQVAATRSKVLESNVGGISPSIEFTETHEKETNDIKRSLAELREREQLESTGESDDGLLGKLKGIFSGK